MQGCRVPRLDNITWGTSAWQNPWRTSVYRSILGILQQADSGPWRGVHSRRIEATLYVAAKKSPRTKRRSRRGGGGERGRGYRGTSLKRNRAPLGLCSRTMPRALGGGGWVTCSCKVQIQSGAERSHVLYARCLQ